MRLILRNQIPFISLFIFLAFLNICLAQNPVPFQGEVNGNNINLRSDSTVNSETICTLNRGYKVEVVSELYEWYKIRLPQIAPSYIKKNLVDCINYTTPNLTDTGIIVEADNRCINAKVSGNRVNIRMRPDESAPILGTIDRNEVIDILREAGKWYKIKPIENSFGWVHKNLIKKLSLVNKTDKNDLSQETEEKTTETGETTLSDENIIVEGIIKPKFITGIATHKLITKDKDIFLLKADEASLNALNFKKAKIIGNKVGPKTLGYTIVEVKIMEVIN